MTFLQRILLCMGVFGCCCSQGSALDCSEEGLKRAQVQCFTRNGVDIDLSSDQAHDVIQNDPMALCQNKRGYTDGLRCALYMGRSCLDQLGMDPNILPDPSKAEDGIDYLCDNIYNVDSQCIKNQQEPMKTCAVNKATAYYRENPTTDIGFITCKAFDLTLDCVKQTLSKCEGQTMEVVIYYTRHYIWPPACKTDVGPGYAFSTMAPVTTMELVTGIPLLPEFSCYNEQTIQEGQKKCFDNEGLSITLPHVQVGESGQEMKKSYLDAIMSNNKDFHAMCRQLPQYQRGMGCAMEVAHRCMPAGYEDYLPESRKIQLMLGELCQNVDDINSECVLEKASALYDCGFRMGSNLRGKSVKQVLCLAFNYNAVCQKQVLPDCGCKTTRLYLDMSKRYLNPPACPAIQESVPECVAGTDLFGSSLATRSVASAALVIFAAALARLFFL